MEYPTNSSSSSDGVLGMYDEKLSSMDVSNNNNPPKKAAFVHKLYAMLSDTNLSNLIWWTNNTEEGTFALQPGADFAHALTGYFKHGNVASFVRQLHMYGFHKVCDQPATNPNGNNHPVWEFIHSSGMFRKGDESSLALIKRRTSSNTTKIKSDLNRSLSGTPAIDIPYQPQGQFYYSTNPYAQPPPPPPPQAKYPQATPYGLVSQSSAPPPPQSIIFYPVPQRYSNASVSPYQHAITPPFHDPNLPSAINPDYQQQQQQQLSPQRTHPHLVNHQKAVYAPIPPANTIPQHQHYYYPTHHVVQQQQLAHLQQQQQQQLAHPQQQQLAHSQQQLQHHQQQQQQQQQQQHHQQQQQQQQQEQQAHQQQQAQHQQQQQQQPQQQQPQPQQQQQPQQQPQAHQQSLQQYQHQQLMAQQPANQLQRATTPTGSSASRQQNSRIATPHSYADPSVNSYVERISTTSRELLYGQQMLHAKSEILNNELKELSNDTIRAVDTIPSVKPNLEESQYAEFQTKVNGLKNNLQDRNQKLEDDDNPSRSHQASIVSNSSQISFYENNSRPRIPSMFVDPLAPLSHQQQDQNLHPHQQYSEPPPPPPTQAAPNPKNRSISSSSEVWNSPSNESRAHSHKTPSIANIISEPGNASSVKRAGSHPGFGNFQPIRVSHRAPTSVPNELYPTANPTDATVLSTTATTAVATFQEPRNNSLTSNPRTSIPGIGHLHSQIRPSLVEFHRSTSPANATSSIASANSNSIFSNKASVSSVSSSVRNSIPQLLNDPIKEESSAQTSNPDFKNTTFPNHASATTSPKIPITSSPNPQSYKPQSYTPKQFTHPAGSSLRMNSTVSPKSARSSSTITKTTLPPIQTGFKREADNSLSNIEGSHESKKPKHN